MKIWTLEVRLVRSLSYYTCYCDENPVKLLLSDDYVDTLSELQDTHIYGIGNINFFTHF